MWQRYDDEGMASKVIEHLDYDNCMNKIYFDLSLLILNIISGKYYLCCSD